MSAIDGRTDLWAVGATMFALLSGEFVHAGDNAAMLRVMAATEPARALASLAPDVPAAVAAIVDRALSFDMNARWPNAKEMREALATAHIAAFGRPFRNARTAVGEAFRNDDPASTAVTTSAKLSDFETDPTELGPARPSPPPEDRIAAMREPLAVSERPASTTAGVSRSGDPSTSHHRDGRWRPRAAVGAVASAILLPGVGLAVSLRTAKDPASAADTVGLAPTAIVARSASETRPPTPTGGPAPITG